MSQQILPIIPKGTTPINDIVSVWRDEEKWVYFGSLVIRVKAIFLIKQHVIIFLQLSENLYSRSHSALSGFQADKEGFLIIRAKVIIRKISVLSEI
ncbi:MAG: hypothetical protein GY710_18535 [Desulfobacteraceae bacterium]|nr:hypothetical protein [Desulfobacteraceae bacterium]